MKGSLRFLFVAFSFVTLLLPALVSAMKLEATLGWDGRVELCWGSEAGQR